MPKPIINAIGPEYLQRESLTEAVLPWEDGRRAPTDRGTFEWWYFDAHFDDQTTAVIVFATKPIIHPGAPLTPNLGLTITRANGVKTAEYYVPSPDQFSAPSEMCDVRIGSNWVKQISSGKCWNFSLHAETTSLAADLTFTGLVPPWRPGAGKGYYGDLEHYFAWLASIPYGSVAGTLTYDGQTHLVYGSGYHDHNWGNVALPSIMDHWYWDRAHVGDYTLIFVEQIAAKRFGSLRMPVFLLAKGEHVLADDASYLTMQTGGFVNHPGGRDYPREVDFRWQHDLEQVHLSLRKPKLIEATSLLGALPPIKRRLAQMFTNPFYFRFETELIMTINLADLHDTVRGLAIYEIMMLK